MSKAAQRQSAMELFPCLHDWTSTTGFDTHYSYLSYWGMRMLRRNPNISAAAPHVDVGSQIAWVMAVAATHPVLFVDIRPFETNIETLEVLSGTILDLPFEDRSLYSLSCLHVAEHIGLGRYGDPLDPKGTERAVAQLARVLAPGGTLLFALPVGRERICFNAHRVHDPLNIVAMFEAHGLRLNSFAGVSDDRTFHPALDPRSLQNADYACGMFEFVR
jgi:SAM-dependent methyltransferase